MSAASPGRNCPLAYRYSPAVFARPAEITTDTLYVIGGLYGNALALDAIEALAAAEPVPPRFVFNGDFHWFDIDAQQFAGLDARVLAHAALRGNVETELAADDDDAGCGCGYPQWVGDAEVERSNAILRTLRATARECAQARARLGALPMHAVASVGGMRIGIVHGDCWSLAGWDFAQELVSEQPARIADAFDAADVRVFASSHTCLPVMQRIDAQAGPCLVANNGAAGMPNFAGLRCGLITRISVHPARDALYGTTLGPLHIDAVPVRYDHERWLQRFDALWPAGSPAALSYRKRIAEGPGYAPERALRTSVSLRNDARPTQGHTADQ